MAFTFIHTADWQLGKSFGQFPADISGALRLARQSVISRIAAAAQQVGAKHVLVAGDVWDSAIPSNTTLRQPLAIMGEAAEIQWWLLPGNHDPDGPDGLWDRIDAVKPENVRTLREPVPLEIEAGVFILPAPWSRIQHGQDLTDWMPTCETPDGALRIGLAHGGVRGFGSEGEGAREIISPDRAETARLDYLALGDWHAHAEISQRTAYPGTPEPDRHKSGARGQVLAVTVDSGQTPKTEIIPTAIYDWPLIELIAEPEKIESQISDLRTALRTGQPLRHTHVRLDISGEMTVENWAQFESFAEEMSGECASFDLRGAKNVRLVVVAQDIESLDAQGSVREAAESLSARSENPDLSLEDRQIASEALRLLFRYAGGTA
ncbi:MAG: DNA repair exonuclease [Litorimonas sp.]